MSRYINADEVIRMLKAHAKDGDNRTFISDETAYAIESFPTIEVSEDSVSRRYLLAEIDDLADEFSELDENGLHSERWCGIMDSKGVIVNAPSAVPKDHSGEPTEMVGEWITYEPEEIGFGTIYECPYCKYEVEFEPTNYCPNCGAKLRLE